MATIVFSALGSAGDIFPLCAIGAELQTRGHSVRMATTPILAPSLRRAGFDAHRVGPFISPRNLRDLGRAASRPGWASMRAYVERLVIPSLPSTAADLCQLAADADVVVTQVHQPAGRIAAELLGIPWITATPYASLLSHMRTRQPDGVVGGRALDTRPPQGPKGIRDWVLRGRSHRFDDAVNRTRRHRGLEPVHGAFLEAALSPLCVAVLSEPPILNPRVRLPAHWRAVGYPVWDDLSPRGRSPGIENLVDGDDQYVVATMGTAALGTMTEFVAASGVAARDAGRPLVVLGSKCVQAALPGRIESATYLSLSRALRNAAAVIHPGGMGTSATALATGVPSVLVPRAFDQRHNARRLEHAGVGVLVRRRGLNPAAVSGALRRALEKPIASQARAVARGLIGDPAREAADLVESWCIPNPRSQDPEAACRGERR